MTEDPSNLDETQAFEGDDFEDDDPEDEHDTDQREPEKRSGPGRVPPGRRSDRSTTGAMGGPRRGQAPAPASRAKTRGLTVDPSLRIRDRVSEAFVIGTLVVFGAILVNALAFGHGGAFTATPTPAPSVEVSAAPSGSVGPSGSPGQSGSPGASPTEAPSTGTSPAPSAS